MLRRMLVAVAAAAVLAATLPLTASAAPVGTSAPTVVDQSTTYTVCYRKRTGELRLLLSTKCPRGWKKIRLAAPREVIDANGTVLGDFLGVDAGFFPAYEVEDSTGGRWVYTPSGVVMSANYSVVHLDAACSGAAYTLIPGAYVTAFATPDPAARAAVVVNGTPVAAYALSGPPAPLGAAPTWYRNETGACVAGGGMGPDPYRIPLVAVPLPIQGVGPLRIV